MSRKQTQPTDVVPETPPVVEEPVVEENIDPMLKAILDMRANQKKREADKQAGIYAAMKDIRIVES